MKPYHQHSGFLAILHFFISIWIHCFYNQTLSTHHTSWLRNPKKHWWDHTKFFQHLMYAFLCILHFLSLNAWLFILQQLYFQYWWRKLLIYMHMSFKYKVSRYIIQFLSDVLGYIIHRKTILNVFWILFVFLRFLM